MPAPKRREEEPPMSIIRAYGQIGIGRDHREAKADLLEKIRQAQER